MKQFKNSSGKRFLNDFQERRKLLEVSKVDESTNQNLFFCWLYIILTSQSFLTHLSSCYRLSAFIQANYNFQEYNSFRKCLIFSHYKIITNSAHNPNNNNIRLIPIQSLTIFAKRNPNKIQSSASLEQIRLIQAELTT